MLVEEDVAMPKCWICGIHLLSRDLMEAHHKIHDGRRLLILGSYRDAVKAFTEVISNHPGLSSAWRYIAEAYRRLGEIEKADAALKEAESIERSKDQEVGLSIPVMEELSQQDLEILKLLVIRGVSNQTVARCMQISEKSSRVEISRILERVDSPSRDFLVHFAEEHGILSSASGGDTNQRSHARGSSYEPLPENVRLKRLIGSNEVLPGQLNGPEGIATDEYDNIYVVEGGHHCVQVFDRSGEFLFKWGSQGSGVGEFNNPQGITLDRSGRVYVVDSGNNRIQVFSHGGAFLSEWGSAGSAVGEFQFPGDIAVSEDGIVYVTDSLNYRVQAFSSEGEFLREWGGYGPEDGRFILPWGIAVGLDGTVFVTEDILNYRVQAFSPRGGSLPSGGHMACHGRCGILTGVFGAQ